MQCSRRPRPELTIKSVPLLCAKVKHFERLTRKHILLYIWTMPEKAPNIKFAEMFNAAMQVRNVTMKQLAAGSDYQYEAFRKLSKGITTPSKDMLNFLHEQIGIDVKQAELAIAEDKARRRGIWKVVQQGTGMHPELDPINRVWDKLSDQDKRELITMAQMKASFNSQRLHDHRRKTG